MVCPSMIVISDTCDKAIQTDTKGYSHALKQGVSKGMSQCDSDTCNKAR